MSDLLDLYMRYSASNEHTPQNNRWTFLSCVSALLGRRVHIPFGHLTIYPNMYVFLVGLPATRKSTSIGVGRDLMRAVGYKTMTYGKTSREKFLLDFEEGFDNRLDNGEFNFEGALDKPLNPLASTVSECFVCDDEFLDFIGMKNFNFLTTLTKLWDNQDNCPERVKNSKSVNIPNPTVNILGGLTPTNLSLILPQEIIGQGYTSRIILVNSGKLVDKITFPIKPNQSIRNDLINELKKINVMEGQIQYSGEAKELLDHIYKKFIPILDGRLQHYCSRRFIHLLKLCAVVCAIRGTLVITSEIVEQANTILGYTEASMHLALGEFGEAKHSKATQRIMEVLTEAKVPMTIIELWNSVSTDLERLNTLNEILNNLKLAKKIIVSQNEDGDAVVLINREVRNKNTVGINYPKWIKEFDKLPD